jgi:hypothetical protein
MTFPGSGRPIHILFNVVMLVERRVSRIARQTRDVVPLCLSAIVPESRAQELSADPGSLDPSGFRPARETPFHS